jgi:hypothetical protein
MVIAVSIFAIQRLRLRVRERTRNRALLERRRAANASKVFSMKEQTSRALIIKSAPMIRVAEYAHHRRSKTGMVGAQALFAVTATLAMPRQTVASLTNVMPPPRPSV